MHNLLRHYSSYSRQVIIENESSAMKFLQEVKCIPTINDKAPNCYCGLLMTAKPLSKSRCGFQYFCSNCSKTLSSLDNTILQNSTIPFKDFLAILFAFVSHEEITKLIEELNAWRSYRREPTIYPMTVYGYYKEFAKVTEVVSSKLGEPEEFLRHNTGLQYYRRTRLGPIKSLGGRIQQFLEDVASVFPGPGKIGLASIKIEKPDTDIKGIELPMPESKQPESEESDIIVIKEEIVEETSSAEYYTDSDSN